MLRQIPVFYYFCGLNYGFWGSIKLENWVTEWHKNLPKIYSLVGPEGERCPKAARISLIAGSQTLALNKYVHSLPLHV